MKQYFNVKTRKEVFIGKPFMVSVTEDGYTTSFETSCLSEPMADMLVQNGILTNNKPVEIPTDFDYYVRKLAKKLNISYEDCYAMLGCLEKYAPANVFSLLAKQVALELDTKYEGHIGKSRELFGVELTTGYIVQMKIRPEASLKNVALFRSTDDALFAIKVLKPVYTKMFQ